MVTLGIGLALLGIIFAASRSDAAGPARVDVILWFDTEDYILPQSDDDEILSRFASRFAGDTTMARWMRFGTSITAILITAVVPETSLRSLPGEEAGGNTSDIWSHSYDLNSAYWYGISDGGRTYTADRLASPWTETGVTWNRRDGASYWTLAGGDFTAQDAASAVLGSRTQIRATVGLFYTLLGREDFGAVARP